MAFTCVVTHAVRPDELHHERGRHRTCRYPGCSRAARRCQLDHIHDWAAGGRTSPGNTHPLCDRHHHGKHEAPWTVHRTDTGDTEWTIRGRQYRKPAEPYPVDHTVDPPDDANRRDTDDAAADGSPPF
jgi:hypothetical protein